MTIACATCHSGNARAIAVRPTAVRLHLSHTLVASGRSRQQAVTFERCQIARQSRAVEFHVVGQRRDCQRLVAFDRSQQGRSVKVKKKIVANILAGSTAAPLHLNGENVMICFKETRWEKWVFGGGRFINT